MREPSGVQTGFVSGRRIRREPRRQSPAPSSYIQMSSCRSKRQAVAVRREREVRARRLAHRPQRRRLSLAIIQWIGMPRRSRSVLQRRRACRCRTRQTTRQPVPAFDATPSMHGHARPVTFICVQIERRREQRPVVHEHEMTARQISAVIALLNDVALAGGQSLDDEVGFALAAGGGARREQHGLAAGQHLRPALRDFPLRQWHAVREYLPRWSTTRA